MTHLHYAKAVLKRALFCLSIASCLLSFSGCTSLVSNAGSRVGTNLSSAILNNNDLEIVKDGAPAYLIFLDSVIQAEPDSPPILLSAAQITNAYATAFVMDPKRSKLMSDKSFNFAQKAACLHNEIFCQLKTAEINEFKTLVNQASKDDVDYLYTLGASWASWIQAHSDDWNSIAEIARVQIIMEKIVAINDRHDNGGGHLYLATLATLLPPALGGKPGEGKKHFERAIAISKGRNLLVKVMYAEQYARLVFDQPLHDRLLKEVITSDPVAPDLTLINTFAQDKAKKLLAETNNYF